MSGATLQDTMQSSSSSPRFRPYASPNHQVTKGRYITSNDPRGYIPVYEYPLNNQWIMMDIDDGYVLWTGIWKALGNSKADIVKMIDSQPDLAPLIRRVRGGYLKIQGTWMPYEVALRLSRRVAWPIRDELIPLFGPTFPSTCLSPDQPGYGQVVASGAARRRVRRNNTTASTVGTALESQANWTVVTPLSSHSTSEISRREPLSSAPSFSVTTMPSPRYPPDQRSLLHTAEDSTIALIPNSSASDTNHNLSSTWDRASSARYSPYPSSASGRARRPSSSRGSLALDIPSLSLRERSPSVSSRSSAQDVQSFVLPPIKSPSRWQNIPRSSYALPPISALEDLRGMSTNDTSAVLQRLRSDDDSLSGSGMSLNDDSMTMKRSLSVPPYKYRPLKQTSGESRGSMHSRSFPEDYDYRKSGADSGHYFHNSRNNSRMPSEPYHDGYSSRDLSPVSPTTPRSSVSSLRTTYHGLVPLSVLKDESRQVASANYEYPRITASFNWVGDRNAMRPFDGMHPTHDVSACRHSCEDDDSDVDSMLSRRPW